MLRGLEGLWESRKLEGKLGLKMGWILAKESVRKLGFESSGHRGVV